LALIVPQLLVFKVNLALLKVTVATLEVAVPLVIELSLANTLTL
jgi:hypothetical protein